MAQINCIVIFSPPHLYPISAKCNNVTQASRIIVKAKLDNNVCLLFNDPHFFQTGSVGQILRQQFIWSYSEHLRDRVIIMNVALIQIGMKTFISVNKKLHKKGNIFFQKPNGDSKDFFFVIIIFYQTFHINLVCASRDIDNEKS